MALTATAQNKVEEDILRVLGIKGCLVLRQSFNRKNLHYEVRPKSGKLMENMVNFIKTHANHASGIVYCSSRDKCEILAKNLREEHDLLARHYHAGMSKGDRRKVQEGWQDREFDIIVATVSLG
jgi:bloom syndrome protein